MKNRTRLIITIGVIVLVAGCTLSFLLKLLLSGGVGGFASGTRTDYGREQKEIVSLAAFSSLSIDLSDADITLTPGDSFSLDYYFRDSRQVFHFEENGGELRIWDVRSQALFGLFPLNFQLFGSSPSNRIKITYPANTDLETMVVRSAFGDIDISSLTANKSEVHLSSGDLTLDSLSAGSFSAENSFGDITLQDVKSESLFKVHLSSGDMAVSAAAGETFNLSNNFGDITLSGITAKELDARLDSGSLAVTNAAAERVNFANSFGRIQGSGLVSSIELVADNSSGDIDLQGDLLGKVTAESDFGDVDIRLTGAKADYSYSLETSFGSVSLDGEKISGVTTKAEYAGGANRITATCSSGDVAVSFSQVP